MRPRNATFLKSASRADEFPAEELPEIAFAGRSNVGKSSLINTLVGRDGLARTSRTPGRTQLLNWFRVDGQAFVDLPGFGYAKVPVAMQASWQKLIESYLGGRRSLKLVVLLVDVRRGVEQEELDLAEWLDSKNIPLLAVVTKIDKVAKNKREPVLAEVKRALGLRRAPIGVSAQDGDGIDDLWRVLAKVT